MRLSANHAPKATPTAGATQSGKPCHPLRAGGSARPLPIRGAGSRLGGSSICPPWCSRLGSRSARSIGLGLALGSGGLPCSPAPARLVALTLSRIPWRCRYAPQFSPSLTLPAWGVLGQSVGLVCPCSSVCLSPLNRYGLPPLQFPQFRQFPSLSDALGICGDIAPNLFNSRHPSALLPAGLPCSRSLSNPWLFSPIFSARSQPNPQGIPEALGVLSFRQGVGVCFSVCYTLGILPQF